MNSEQQFTPGPWKVSVCNEHINRADDENVYCLSVRTLDGKVVPSTRANLALKSAAPDLLEAAQLAVRFWNSDHPNDTAEGHEALEKIKAAIRKATQQ